MSYSDPLKFFNELKEKETASATSGGGSFGNPYLLKLKKGCSYSFRLLWLPSDVRDYPMINQYVHHFWDDNAIGSKDVSVICPTSQYDVGDNGNGFKACPICSYMSKLYKQAEEGSESAKQLYKKFKRTLKGYVPVYVVNGPEEDKHKIKILPYSISFKRYFDEKIFGIKQTDNQNDSSENDESNIFGIDVFMYYNPKTDEVVTSGHNLIVNVQTKKIPIEGKGMIDMPDYKIEFSIKKTDITDFDGNEITPKYFKSLSAELNFDQDFYKMSNQENLTKFMNKYIIGEDDEVEFVKETKKVVDSDTMSSMLNKVKPSKAVIEEDEEEELPKPKKKSIIEDEEEELPKPKKKPIIEDDDDEEELPKPKKKQVEEDEDDDEFDDDELNDLLKSIDE